MEMLSANDLLQRRLGWSSVSVFLKLKCAETKSTDLSLFQT